jgi:hypothetical protein
MGQSMDTISNWCHSTPTFTYQTLVEFELAARKAVIHVVSKDGSRVSGIVQKLATTEKCFTAILSSHSSRTSRRTGCSTGIVPIVDIVFPNTVLETKSLLPQSKPDTSSSGLPKGNAGHRQCTDLSDPNVVQSSQEGTIVDESGGSCSTLNRNGSQRLVEVNAESFTESFQIERGSGTDGEDGSVAFRSQVVQIGLESFQVGVPEKVGVATRRRSGCNSRQEAEEERCSEHHRGSSLLQWRRRRLEKGGNQWQVFSMSKRFAKHSHFCYPSFVTSTVCCLLVAVPGIIWNKEYGTREVQATTS